MFMLFFKDFCLRKIIFVDAFGEEEKIQNESTKKKKGMHLNGNMILLETTRTRLSFRNEVDRRKKP